jgi:transposase
VAGRGQQINHLTAGCDARGLNTRQRNGTLPTVRIPPGELRDQRELPRTGMALVPQRTQLQNRLHATLAKYALHAVEVSDLFGVRGRQLPQQRRELLPPHTAYATRELLEQVESPDRRVSGFEHRIKSVFKPTRPIQLLTTMPGLGLTLAVVIALEIGDVTRFPTAEKLASYAGCTCRVHASGDKLRYGRLRPDVNRYLKWAFIEAANAILSAAPPPPAPPCHPPLRAAPGAWATPRPSAPWPGISRTSPGIPIMPRRRRRYGSDETD